MNVLTFGEALFRLSSIKGERLSSSNQINFYLGGSELNIAANLNSLGIKASWISALPDRMTGELMKDKIQDFGVETGFCEIIENGRPGWYLMETGASPRPDIVLNRYASSLSEMTQFNFKWDEALKNQKIFHTSGITAGLSVNLTEEVKNAMTLARQKNILVSYDFNYRKNIWSIEEFTKRQKDLLPLIDILFCAESDLELFFKKKIDDRDYSKIFAGRNLKYLVINQRAADESEYGINVITPDQVYKSKVHKVQHIDRIGVGDSMAAGFMAGFLKSQDLQTACEWGSLAGAMKYGIKGDMALLASLEIEALLQSNSRSIIR